MDRNIVLGTPRPVVGHPIEILAVSTSEESHIWLVTLRINTSDPAVVREFRYNAGDCITLELPPDESGRQAMLNVRGLTPWEGNPLSEAVQAIVKEAAAQP